MFNPKEARECPGCKSRTRSIWREPAGGMLKSRSDLDRRRFLGRVGAAGIGAGALAIGARAALAQADMGPIAPPSTVTTPPRDFGPSGCAERLFLGCGRHRGRSVVQRPGAAERSDPAPVDRGAVGRGPGLEQRRQVPGLERHPEQPADALDRGRRPRLRLPHAVEQQQRQHLRLPGPADLLRAPHPARGPLRARRLDHGARRLLERQAAQLAQRRGPASGRQRLVHRPALWRPALRRHPRSRRRQEQPGGQAQQPGRSARRGQRYRSRSCPPRSIDGTRAAASTW